MKEQKKKIFTWRINLFIFLIFSLGCIFGVAISGIQIPSLEGYLMSKATTITTNSYQDIEADPSCYATSPNATCSDVDYGNATSPNATSDDARDDFILLTQLTAENTSAQAGQRIYLHCYTYGNCLNGATLTFYNNNIGLGFTSQLEFEGDTTFITIPEETVPATYDFSSIILNATSYGSGTFTKMYGANDIENKLSITVEKNESIKDIELKKIDFEKDEIAIGENLGVILQTDVEVSSAKFTFKNTQTEQLVTAYMKKDGGKDYISFASSTKEGTYELTKLVLSNSNSTTIYSKDEDQSSIAYNFDNKIKVNSGDNTTLEYNNEEITSDDVTEIATSNNVQRVIINADTKSVISEDIFNAVKGKTIELIINYKGNQFIFIGQEITTTKDIDVSIKSYSLVSRFDEIKNFVGENGVVVNFASNGNLPSKARIKIKQTSEMKTVLGSNSIYVYYYDDLTQKFEEVVNNLVADSDGYYTFSVTHNSKFLFTTEKLDDSLLQETEDENVVSFLMSNKVYLILIILALVLIVVVIVIIIVYNKKKKEVTNTPVAPKKEDYLTDKKIEEIKTEEVNEDNKDTQKEELQENNEDKKEE